MRLAWEEQFGPVLPVVRVTSADAAVEHCNASRLALQGCVFTQDVNEALRISDAMMTGTVQVRQAPRNLSPLMCEHVERAHLAEAVTAMFEIYRCTPLHVLQIGATTATARRDGERPRAGERAARARPGPLPLPGLPRLGHRQPGHHELAGDDVQDEDDGHQHAAGELHHGVRAAPQPAQVCVIDTSSC
jgi:Aldehyde dehydrogenase family